MTPTEQDKELREIIWYELGDGLNATDVDEAVKSIKNYFTADRERVELEARINELEKIEINGDNIWTVDNSTDTAMLIGERIAELKAQQEKL